MTTYFAFAIADSMFPEVCTIRRRTISADRFKALVGGGVVSCLNPSHTATIDLLRLRYGVDIAVAEIPQRVTLIPNDRLIVMSVRGLPRLTDRHQYTSVEIERAEVSFALYEVD